MAVEIIKQDDVDRWRITRGPASTERVDGVLYRRLPHLDLPRLAGRGLGTEETFGGRALALRLADPLPDLLPDPLPDLLRRLILSLPRSI